MPFIGRATGEKLKYIVKTIEEFRTLPFRRVHEILGKNGTDLWLELNGVDIMSFANPDTPKSISRTRSFNDTICSDKEFLWEKILINLERSYKDLMWRFDGNHELLRGGIEKTFYPQLQEGVFCEPKNETLWRQLHEKKAQFDTIKQ